MSRNLKYAIALQAQNALPLKQILALASYESFIMLVQNRLHTLGSQVVLN